MVKLVMATPWEPPATFSMATPWEPLSPLGGSLSETPPGSYVGTTPGSYVGTTLATPWEPGFCFCLLAGPFRLTR